MSESRPLRRTTGDERVIRGVAGGVARWLGVDPVLVRIAFVVLGIANGLGVVLYLVGAFALPDDAADQPGEAARADRAAAPPATRRFEQALGVGLVTVGLLLLVRRVGLFLPDTVFLPLVLAGAAAAVGWMRLDAAGTSPLDAGRSVVVRIVAGSVLLAVSIGIFVALNERIVVATQIVLAVLAATAGILVLAGPWIVRLARQVGQERAERIRADERAEVAAHLHDSVLQTLALIQRRADSPAETIALARRQERELRSWLFGDGSGVGTEPGAPGRSFAESLRAIADEVEADHPVAIDVVVVGDASLDERAAALVAATREAVLNAARHSGAPDVSVYGEVDDEELTAFVRDRGRGFDPASVPEDRRGLADSIHGRLARNGGEAQLTTVPGEGTELVLRVSRVNAAGEVWADG